MKTKLIKYSTVHGKNEVINYGAWTFRNRTWIEKVIALLITKQENTGRSGDFKQALGPKRFHHLCGGRLQRNVVAC